MILAQSAPAVPLAGRSQTEDPPSDPAVPQIALGIVTYNNETPQLRRLLHSIDHAAARLDPARFGAEVITIDCGAPAEWCVTRLPFRRLEHRGNLGFGGGMNRLMAEAFSDPSVVWFLCVNPDGLLHHALLTEMLRCSLKYPESLIEARQFPEEHPKPYDPTTGETPWASGACLLIPRRIYETIGGFDDNIFMYMEDVDYSWRARAAGFAVRVAPLALFAHSVLDREPDPRITKFYFDSARYLAAKWGRPEEQAAYERTLRELGLYEGGGLPPLPEPSAVSAGGRHVADFSHGFAFAPRRW
jgi:GT2 family glycosyltransferase